MGVDDRNHLAATPTGYVGLAVLGGQPRTLTDADGLSVEVVSSLPNGALVQVTMASAKPDEHRRWFVDGLKAALVDENLYATGETLVTVVHSPGQPETTAMFGLGFRYLTVQVADVVAEHERLVGMGFREATPPVRLGDVAAISFVCDPGGNWLEISQRASLAGDLPEEL